MAGAPAEPTARALALPLTFTAARSNPCFHRLCTLSQASSHSARARYGLFVPSFDLTPAPNGPSASCTKPRHQSPSMELQTGRVYTFCIWARTVGPTTAATLTLQESTTYEVYAWQKVVLNASWQLLCLPNGQKPADQGTTWARFYVCFGTAVTTFYFDQATVTSSAASPPLPPAPPPSPPPPQPSFISGNFDTPGITSDGYDMWVYSSVSPRKDPAVRGLIAAYARQTR